MLYHIDEGAQQRVDTVTLDGNTHVEAALLLPLLNTRAGQLVSPQNLAGDRDTLLSEYLSRGFDEVQVNVEQKPEAANANLLDVTFAHHRGAAGVCAEGAADGTVLHTATDRGGAPSRCIRATL